MCLCLVWVKPPAWIFLTFSPNAWGFLVQFLLSDYTFLSTLDYKFLFNHMQLWQSCAILSATTIICSKCPPSAKTHAGWSHLIWYKFVKIGDNWIKICNRTYNRHVKFGLKITNHFGKNVRKPREIFYTHCINYVVFLNMVRIVQGRYEQSKVRIVREPYFVFRRHLLVTK